MFFRDIIKGICLGLFFSILIYIFCNIDLNLAIICFIGLSFSCSVFINMIRKHDAKVLSNMIKDNFNNTK